ncbi:MAG: glycosyltransferase [Leptolyngbyaceae bacterium]|nr:glycosyltransferase [Leptolyngbyaceae bacterium]
MGLTLSVVIPVYNEIHTIDTVLTKVVQAIPNVAKEIVLVDDGSKDGTRDWLIETFGDPTDAPVVKSLPPDHPIVTADDPTSIASQPVVVAVGDRAPVPSRLFFIATTKGKEQHYELDLSRLLGMSPLSRMLT